MRRREFVGGLVGSAAWVLSAGAQQAAIPVVGFLRSTSLNDVPHFVSGFREGLKEAGFLQGQNIEIEFSSAEGSPERLTELAADLIRRRVAVIIANAIAALAVKGATTTVPIVFTTSRDPIRDGLVASLNQPGGNVTGVLFFASSLGAKRLELLRQLLPHVSTIAMLVNPNSSNTESERNDVQTAAQIIGQRLLIYEVYKAQEIEAAFTTFAPGAGALIVGSGTLLNSNRERMIALAARHSLPAIFSQREAVMAGGLISYGTSQSDAYRQAGVYTARILKGERPGDLPVIRATKFELIINTRTAKALDLTIPSSLLAQADEVIE